MYSSYWLITNTKKTFENKTRWRLVRLLFKTIWTLIMENMNTFQEKLLVVLLTFSHSIHVDNISGSPVRNTDSNTDKLKTKFKLIPFENNRFKNPICSKYLCVIDFLIQVRIFTLHRDKIHPKIESMCLVNFFW